MNQKIFNAVATLVISGVMGNVTPAQAGGVFGHGGVFRGSVGNWLDKHVEQPILTPVAKTTTIAVGAAVGTAAGALVGAPEAGAVIGAGVGNAVNEAAAGNK